MPRRVTASVLLLVLLFGFLAERSLISAAPHLGLVSTFHPEIELNLDVIEVLPNESSAITPPARILAELATANRLWKACGISFKPRETRQVSAMKLGIPFQPRSHAELSDIYSGIFPLGAQDHGGAVPLIVAGDWQNFNSAETHGLTKLFGLGWYNFNNGKLHNFGAMIDSKRINEPSVSALIGHELGHALSLDDSSARDNLMAGGTHLTQAQCKTARDFSKRFLSEFVASVYSSSASEG